MSDRSLHLRHLAHSPAAYLSESIPQHLLRELVGRRCRLSILRVRVRPARQSLEHRLERLAERALAQPRPVEVRAPDEVGVAEDEFDGDDGVLVRPADDAAGADDVADDLNIEGPVARVVEDEDGVDGRGGEVHELQKC